MCIEKPGGTGPSAQIEFSENDKSVVFKNDLPLPYRAALCSNARSNCASISRHGLTFQANCDMMAQTGLYRAIGKERSILASKRVEFVAN